MRVFSVSFFALASLVQAHAQGIVQDTVGTGRKPEPSLSDACHYTIGGYSHEVPAGRNLCWRVPYPYLSEYGLLHCDPKNNFQEIAMVRRGDPRCDRYEIRQ
jgi:hypothetical protein